MNNYILPTGTDGFAYSSSSSNQESLFPILKDFEILKEIAVGGMGIVYKAFDRIEENNVALKVLNLAVLLPGEREEEIARFQREGKVALSLQQKNMVEAYKMGCEGGTWYYSMELVEGEDFGEIIDKGEELSEEEVANMGIVVAEVLEYIHQRGMVHRDIKPDNILRGFDGITKVCDYGLMRHRIVSSSITSLGISIGTPNYMSPEQAKGDEELDIRSDVYSLGITMFHLLAGQTPFESSSVTMTLSRHIFETVPSVRRYNDEVSLEMEAIITKMTHKNPDARYQNPWEIASDLRDLKLRMATFSTHVESMEESKKLNKQNSTLSFRFPS